MAIIENHGKYLKKIIEQVLGVGGMGGALKQINTLNNRNHLFCIVELLLAGFSPLAVRTSRPAPNMRQVASVTKPYRMDPRIKYSVTAPKLDL